MTFKNRPWLGIGFALLLLGGAPAAALGQGTPADYARATSLRDRYERVALDIAGPPTAIGQTHRFWYRKSVKGGDEFVVVDADTQQKQPAFDHERIAQELSRATGESYTALHLPFNTVAFTDDGSAFTATVAGSPYRCTIADSSCRKSDAGSARGRGVERRPAQQGRGAAAVSGRQMAGADQQLQPRDQTGAWRRADPSEYRRVRGKLVRGVVDRVVARLAEDRRLPRAARLPVARCTTSNRRQKISSSRSTRRSCTRSPATFSISISRCCSTLRPSAKPSSTTRSSRTRTPTRSSCGARTAAPSPSSTTSAGHQVYRVIEVNAATGKARAVISEEPKTFFNYRPANGTLADSGKKFRCDVDDGKEIVWMSERDGWNHLYLYDGVTGAVKNQITKGEWVVRGVQHVDPVARQIWFSAGGMYRRQGSVLRELLPDQLRRHRTRRG